MGWGEWNGNHPAFRTETTDPRGPESINHVEAIRKMTERYVRHEQALEEAKIREGLIMHLIPKIEEYFGYSTEGNPTSWRINAREVAEVAVDGFVEFYRQRSSPVQP